MWVGTTNKNLYYKWRVDINSWKIYTLLCPRYVSIQSKSCIHLFLTRLLKSKVPIKDSNFGLLVYRSIPNILKIWTFTCWLTIRQKLDLTCLPFFIRKHLRNIILYSFGKEDVTHKQRCKIRISLRKRVKGSPEQEI